MNPFMQLQAHGQSIWLDFIKRDFLKDGSLLALIDSVALKGVTSNPAIFEKSISQGTEYDEAIRQLIEDSKANAVSIYESLAIADIQEAADILLPVYRQTKHTDGYVSLEVSPFLAHDAQGTINEALRLWSKVARPNLMIKVPATDAGILAIESLIEEGLNVNVTLLFSKTYYKKAAMAYIAGLEARISQGKSINHIHSVASFFISRIDSYIDAKLTTDIADISEDERARKNSLQGKAAIANAKLTYQQFKAIYAEDRWQGIAQHGGNPQRLLWASTSTKNPNYNDVMYVEELIGKNTVNTLPPATLEAFKDHGIVRNSLENNLDEAKQMMDELASIGIDFEEVCKVLTKDGVELFVASFDKLLSTIESKRALLRQ